MNFKLGDIVYWPQSMNPEYQYQIIGLYDYELTGTTHADLLCVATPINLDYIVGSKYPQYPLDGAYIFKNKKQGHILTSIFK